MLKNLHLLLVTLVFISFVGRVLLAEFKPAIFQQKWLKIAPHVIDTLLLMTGIALVFQGNWLTADYGWIVGKLMLLIIYIGLGMAAMRHRGPKRWLAATGAVICLLYIAKIAISKNFFGF
ncbi:SirB2 family protein [Methylomonas rapida]|jgi:uncharacterized membrane protein SirB2|uniref:SirB2 family protein n=1 Tax=Methylomonas rapida TaxID=2963939 RepID=A0ABY7GLI9_9GAMM|nr:SirB2 family protein [Methylomonas rapida]WAR45379.1 SirB2 family protein [Methylomonas rapida]